MCLHIPRLFAILMFLSCAACASVPHNGFWQRTWEGALTTRVIYVDVIAGSGDWGHVEGWVLCDKVKRHCDLFIYSGAQDRQCIEAHERKHAAGYDHPAYRRSLACINAFDMLGAWL